MDKRKNNKGVTGNKGGGRKSLAVEKSAIYIMQKAIKKLYDCKTDEEAKIAFLKNFALTQRGQQFIAEHLFGKPKDIVENINRNFAIRELTAKEIKALNNELENEY